MIYSLKTQRIMVYMLWLSFVIGIIISVLNSVSVFYSGESDYGSIVVLKYIDIVLRVIFSIVTAYLFFVCVPISERRFNIPEISILFWLNLALIIFSFIVGVASGNDLYYVFGDTYREFVFFIGLFILLWIYCGLASSGKFDTIVFFIEIYVVSAIIASVAIYYIRWHYPYLKISNVAAINGIIWALFQNRRSWIVTVPVLLFCTIACLVSGKRAIFIIMLCTYIFYAMYLLVTLLVKNDYYGRLLKAKTVKMAMGLIGVIIVILMLFPIVLDTVNWLDAESFYVKSSLTLMKNVYGIAIEGEKDASYDGRVQELKNVLFHMENNPQTWFFGSGQGAEIENPPYAYVKSNDDKMHMVHITWIAIVFRTGIVGLLLYLYSYYITFKYLYSISSSKYLNWKMYSIVGLVMVFMSSFSSLYCTPLYSLALLAAIKCAVRYDESVCLASRNI